MSLFRKIINILQIKSQECFISYWLCVFVQQVGDEVLLKIIRSGDAGGPKELVVKIKLGEEK
jgi:hypothetical protein